jgi:UDP-N-acetyl-D-mannosaminuronate dehydrogenase
MEWRGFYLHRRKKNGGTKMSTSRHLIDAAELFVSMPVTVLAQAVEALGYENPQYEMSRVLSLQQALKQDFESRNNMALDLAEALYNLADEAYANEDDMQTNVDPLEMPFDMSEADEGTWAHAWVWVPNDELEKEVWRIQEERRQQKLREKEKPSGYRLGRRI